MMEIDVREDGSYVITIIIIDVSFACFHAVTDCLVYSLS